MSEDGRDVTTSAVQGFLCSKGCHGDNWKNLNNSVGYVIALHTHSFPQFGSCITVT